MSRHTTQKQHQSAKPRKSTPRVSKDIFLIILWLFAKGLSTRSMAKELKLSERTVGGYLRKIRNQIHEAADASKPLLGDEVQVQAYTYKPLATRRYAKRPVLLALMGPDEDVRLFVIKRRTQAEIYPLVHANVQRGTTLITNGSNLYIGLRKEGYPKVQQYSSGDDAFGFYLLDPTGAALSDFWQDLFYRIGKARGVRPSTFLQRAREAELRWNFRRQGAVGLYRYLVALLHLDPQ